MNARGVAPRYNTKPSLYTLYYSSLRSSSSSSPTLTSLSSPHQTKMPAVNLLVPEERIPEEFYVQGDGEIARPGGEVIGIYRVIGKNEALSRVCLVVFCN